MDEEEQPQERNSQDQETSESIPDEEPVGEQNEENEPEPVKVNQVVRSMVDYCCVLTLNFLYVYMCI